MLVGGVIQNQVEYELHASAMHLLHELFNQCHIAILRRDRKIIADIVSEIPVWTLRKWRNPDCFVTEVFKIIQFSNNTRNVSNSIAIGIEKGTQIDMVNGGFLPPFHICIIERG